MLFTMTAPSSRFNQTLKTKKRKSATFDYLVIDFFAASHILKADTGKDLSWFFYRTSWKERKEIDWTRFLPNNIEERNLIRNASSFYGPNQISRKAQAHFNSVDGDSFVCWASWRRGSLWSSFDKPPRTMNSPRKQNHLERRRKWRHVTFSSFGVAVLDATDVADWLTSRQPGSGKEVARLYWTTEILLNSPASNAN